VRVGPERARIGELDRPIGRPSRRHGVQSYLCKAFLSKRPANGSVRAGVQDALQAADNGIATITAPVRS
jgi:hypothetical protein